MKINESLSIEQELSIKYKILSLEIFKFLSLNIQQRGIQEIEFLNKIYGNYIKLIELSEIIFNDKKDHLIKIDFLDNESDSRNGDSSIESEDNTPRIINEINEV
jgi:hypothetical protein